MNDSVSSLYTLAHDLLNLGMDGSPIYSDHFAHLNREVYEQAIKLYNTPGSTVPEEEAELCLSILVALSATFYDNGRKQQYIQATLDRCWNILDQLPASLLKVRLLTCCYGEVYEDNLTAEAHAIIDTWDKSSLTPEQAEIIEELKNMEDNQYPFEVLEE
ncbi:MAG: UpxZ family transcription anti-terminator antagonist [Bacteroides sp.]|nr:UpxZ family transcription anti-terminator antagonist [Bacteroides sp.]